MRTLVTGSHGMIGRNVVSILDSSGADVKLADIAVGIDLRTARMVDEAIDGCSRVFHLADRTAGLGYAKTHHGQMMTDSLLMSLQMLEAARWANVTDYLYVSSSCVYPDVYADKEVPESYADYYTPERANEGYGWAKRIAEKQCRYFHKEYGMRTIIVRPANVYGPSYNWSRPVEDMHVIPALITKMLRGDKEIMVWGRGKQKRTFQYEKQTAQLILGVMEKGFAGEAYNLGGWEMSIQELVDELVKICGYQGRVIYDKSKPEGPRRKAQDISKLMSLLPWSSVIEGVESIFGLELTVEAAREALRAQLP